ncbi:MAG: hypothetical protein FWE62_01445, partial [Firmicutes bacterium]|nr:hypothetical protein [Bacillota bacterium]
MKKLLLLMLCLMMAFAAFGCGVITDDDDDDDSSDPRTRLYVGVYKAGFGTDWLEGIGGAYEAYNTDVKVSYIGDPGMQGTL